VDHECCIGEAQVEVSNLTGIKTKAILSRMDHPIGFQIGNALEVIESVECMKGNGEHTVLKTLVKTLGKFVFCI
jgi:thymidine phosphorylase